MSSWTPDWLDQMLYILISEQHLTPQSEDGPNLQTLPQILPINSFPCKPWEYFLSMITVFLAWARLPCLGLLGFSVGQAHELAWQHSPYHYQSFQFFYNLSSNHPTPLTQFHPSSLFSVNNPHFSTTILTSNPSLSYNPIALLNLDCPLSIFNTSPSLFIIYSPLFSYAFHCS